MFESHNEFRIYVPPIEEDRIRVVSAPQSKRFSIVGYDGVMEVDLANYTTQPLDDDPYEFVGSDRTLFGLSGNPPVLSSSGTKIEYTFKPRDNFIEVSVNRIQQSRSLQFPILSGDWFVGLVSDDGAHIVLAEPHRVWVVCLEHSFAFDKLAN